MLSLMSATTNPINPFHSIPLILRPAEDRFPPSPKEERTLTDTEQEAGGEEAAMPSCGRILALVVLLLTGAVAAHATNDENVPILPIDTAYVYPDNSPKKIPAGQEVRARG